MIRIICMCESNREVMSLNLDSKATLWWLWWELRIRSRICLVQWPWCINYSEGTFKAVDRLPRGRVQSTAWAVNSALSTQSFADRILFRCGRFMRGLHDLLSFSSGFFGYGHALNYDIIIVWGFPTFPSCFVRADPRFTFIVFELLCFPHLRFLTNSFDHQLTHWRNFFSFPRPLLLLKAYLRLEAEDKKQVTRTSEAVGKQAQVSDLLCLSEVVDQIHSAYKRCLCNRTIAIVAYTSFTSLKHSCWIQKSIAKWYLFVLFLIIADHWLILIW